MASYTAKVDALTIKFLTTEARTIIANWICDVGSKSDLHNREYIGKVPQVQGYTVEWFWSTDDYNNFTNGTESIDTRYKLYSTFAVPENAVNVWVRVKPEPVRKSDGTSYEDWEGVWVTSDPISATDAPPIIPSAPTVTISKARLTATLDNLSVNASKIAFEVVKDNFEIVATGESDIVTSHAEFSCDIEAGSYYKVRCRSIRDAFSSNWSAYSESISSRPATPTGFRLTPKSKTEITVSWSIVPTATSYEIEYATDRDSFNLTENTVKKTTELNAYVLTGLETDKVYYVRVRAANSADNSPWTKILSVAIGGKPAPPSTWASSTVVTNFESVTLYWIHNGAENSEQTGAVIHVNINEHEDEFEIPISGDTTDEQGETTKIRSYTLDTTRYKEGARIRWRVKTKSVTDEYSDWSIERQIDVFTKPGLDLRLLDQNGKNSVAFDSLPIRVVTQLTNINNQTPLNYAISITANRTYYTADNTGTTTRVSAGEEIYSKSFVTSDDLDVLISAGDAAFEHQEYYTLHCTATMDSGLTAESEVAFQIIWHGALYFPNATISIDKYRYTAFITPFVETADGTRPKNLLLSVYRRDYDGSLSEIITDIPNEGNSSVTDLYPSLDAARYRIVAKEKETGRVSYTDLEGVKVGCTSILLWWDEQWSNYEESLTNAFYEYPSGVGSTLELKYNVDISDKNKPDVELVEYIGRSHPTSYYGTHIGTTSSWSTVVPSTDKETIYQLRRLAKYLGDVYVREPYGSGYWANVTVSFNQTHDSLIVPVTLEITRVEGGKHNGYTVFGLG